jgi:hypothetical protein
MSTRLSYVARALAALWLLLAFACHATDVPRLDLAVDLDPDTRSFSAVAQFETTQHELRVRLHRSLSIRTVTLDGKPIALRAPSPSGEYAMWIVTLGERGKVVMTYSGTLPTLDAGMDHRGVLRIAAPMASPAGSFLSSGSSWYPVPRDLFTYRVTLTLPGAQRGLVAGDLVEETLPSPAQPRYRAVFELKQPAEGIDLMAGPYVVDERVVDRPDTPPLRLRTYFTAALRPLSGGYLDDSARYIEMYSKAIGAYPYASFSVVASPLPAGFGMPTLTYMGAEVLKLPFIRATSLGHEVLHNWWGNGVYPDYASGNWSEGLTTFMADYAYKERESPAAARDMRLSWMRDIAAIPAEARISLAQFRSRTHGAEAAAGYGKAAMVFFMLRDLIGTEAYDRGIRTFWEQHRFKTASWRDLQLAFERASGMKLQTFFDQWLRRNDAPQLSLTEAAGTSSSGRYGVAVKIAQRGAPYALRVPVVTTSGETHWVAVDNASIEAQFETGAKTEAVKLDPDLRVWRQLQGQELPPILRVWIVASAPRYIVASADAGVQNAAAKLARRLFETTAQRATEAALRGTSDPTLIVGFHADVDALLARVKLPARPAALATAATAYVWTVQEARPGYPPVAVISARDTASLEALLRPLPHYGAQSYLAFEDARVVSRGIWPVASPAVPVNWR